MKSQIALGGAALLGGAATGAQRERRPNVLLIMTDTQRFDDMGAYGNPVIQTPNLDALCNGGCRFDRCHTQYPACMPARATVFTGRYPMAHGVWSNGVALPESERTLAHWLADAGYRTGGAGKFHFLPHHPYRSPLPTMETHPGPFYGFQEFHLGEDGRSGEHWQWIREFHPEYENAPDHEIPPELHNTHWATSHTIDFMREAVRAREPFFAFCSYVDPHQSYNPPPPYRDMYAEADMPGPVRREGELNGTRFERLLDGNMKRYNERTAYFRTQHYGEMSFIDDHIKRLTDALDELSVRDNTIIVFVSDHGDMLGDHWLWWKGAYHYRACTGVPFFVHWPGRVKPGNAVDGMVQQTDVVPTVLDLLGIEIPPGVQGRSLKPILTGETNTTGYEFAYSESVSSGAVHPEFQTNPGRGADTLTIRNHEWRFTVHSGAGTGELYDLKNDPDEFENRWDDPAFREIRSDLTLALLDRAAATRDPLPQRTHPY